MYYVLTPAYGDFMDCQQAVLLGVIAALDELGISSALPGRPLLLSEDREAKGAIWPLKSGLLKKLSGA